ncbi:Hypothetical predicted protein [Drosophila guanche]|uniref:Uncharacterized protein n=1 Tax=Drosophila guanche TaxID=7266 RepID=A0A3B0K2M6_DROGU|nr:Hypothetical predicted protein [Drosophila guanche]
MIATLDAGATWSFLSEQKARLIETSANRRTVRTTIALANGTRMELTRAIQAEVRLGQSRASLLMLVLPSALDDVLLGLDFFAAIDAKLQVGGLLIPLSRANHVTTECHRPAKTSNDDACTVVTSPGRTRIEDDPGTCNREVAGGSSSTTRTSKDDACIREAVVTRPGRTRKQDDPGTCNREAVVTLPGRTRKQDDPGTCNREVTGGSSSTTRTSKDDACIREAVVTLPGRTRKQDDPGTCNREVTGWSASTTRKSHLTTLAVRTRTTQDDACIREAVAIAAWRTRMRDDPGTCNREVNGGPSATTRTNPDDACIREAVVSSAEATIVREDHGTERDRTWRGALGPARLKATQQNPFRSRPEDLPVSLRAASQTQHATLCHNVPSTSSQSSSSQQMRHHHGHYGSGRNYYDMGGAAAGGGYSSGHHQHQHQQQLDKENLDWQLTNDSWARRRPPQQQQAQQTAMGMVMNMGLGVNMGFGGAGAAISSSKAASGRSTPRPNTSPHSMNLGDSTMLYDKNK